MHENIYYMNIHSIHIQHYCTTVLLSISQNKKQSHPQRMSIERLLWRCWWVFNSCLMLSGRWCKIILLLLWVLPFSMYAIWYGIWTPSPLFACYTQWKTWPPLSSPRFVHAKLKAPLLNLSMIFLSNMPIQYLWFTFHHEYTTSKLYNLIHTLFYMFRNTIMAYQKTLAIPRLFSLYLAICDHRVHS